MEKEKNIWLYFLAVDSLFNNPEIVGRVDILLCPSEDPDPDFLLLMKDLFWKFKKIMH